MLKSGQLFHQFQVVETGIQDKQTITASVSLILQAASDMSQYLELHQKSQAEKLTPCLL